MAQAVIWSQEALDDIDSIAEYISRDSIYHAQQVVEKIFDLGGSLTEQPKLGRKVPELNDSHVREYFIYSYRPLADCVRVRSEGNRRRFVMSGRVARYIRLLRLEDAVFAIPALLASLQLSGAGWPGAGKTSLLALALVAGGAAGLVLNRWIDREIDRRNPRTRDRLMASGAIGTGEAAGLLALTLGSCLALIWVLSPQLMHLTPIFLALLIGYPFLKRFTWACNLFVGIQLSIIPLWTWLVFNDAFPALPILSFTGFILTYGIGIEVIYATGDVASDRETGIHSIPARFGVERARQVSIASFAAALALLVACVGMLGASPGSLLFVGSVAGVFGIQLALARAERYESASLVVNLAVSPLALGAVLLAGSS